MSGTVGDINGKSARNILEYIFHGGAIDEAKLIKYMYLIYSVVSILYVHNAVGYSTIPDRISESSNNTHLLC